MKTTPATAAEVKSTAPPPVVSQSPAETASIETENVYYLPDKLVADARRGKLAPYERWEQIIKVVKAGGTVVINGEEKVSLAALDMLCTLRNDRTITTGHPSKARSKDGKA